MRSMTWGVPRHRSGFLQFLGTTSDRMPRDRVSYGMTTTKNHRERQHTLGSLLSAAWDSFAVRLTVLGFAIGAVPFYFLSMAVAHIGG